MNPNPPSNMNLVEWSLLGLLGAGFGMVIARSLGGRSFATMWIAGIAGGAAGLKLATNAFPPPQISTTTAATTSTTGTGQ